ncbi:SMI1/KNR4 family protein [Leminorella grimontii]|uniref:SMI1/KNR4 family protein n=1 Tax=Leminorella grimontii TaxID=82981 RepID=UPI002088602C|nr:SMI1/KNR4 family protein [Leminorella grimontii]GKX59011.1 hypothetical protein SOASR031_13260 [Leminorella grimontii]
MADMLLTIEEIARRLSEKFQPLVEELDLGDLLLKKRTTESDSAEVERVLGIALPDEFKDIISHYDFDDFSLGNVHFSSGEKGYVQQLIAVNEPDDFSQWWTGDTRPEGIIVIALTDPYTLLLNTLDGAVYAMTSESSMEDVERVASSFSLFIRGVGSAFFDVGGADEIPKAVGAQASTSFWREVVN